MQNQPYHFKVKENRRIKKITKKIICPFVNLSSSTELGLLFSFLSFLISWIVFLIPVGEFDSRISLTVGGIFGAIGNRYF